MRFFFPVFVIPKRDAAVVCKRRNDDQGHEKT